MKNLIALALLLLNLSAPAFGAELSYAILGDSGHWNSSTREVRTSLLRTAVRKLVMPGDNLYVGSDYNAPWSHWTSQGFTFDAVAIGNHTAGYAREVEFFRMPGEYYSLVPEPGVRFLVLNSDNVRTAAEQATWLDHQLTTATESVILPMFHHAPLTITSFHGWEERRAFHEAVRPILFKHRSKLTALIVGHDHIASLLSFDGLPVIVSGAAMEQRRPEPRGETQQGILVKTEWLFDRAPYWVRLDIDTVRADVTARFIRSRDDRESCTARMRSGASAELSPNCAATFNGTRFGTSR